MAARLLSARNIGIPKNTETLCEFDEEDVWNLHSVSSEINGKHESAYKSPIKFSRNGKRPAGTSRMIPAATPSASGEKLSSSYSSSSAPVNIPDWSKILREDFTRSGGGGFEYENDDGEEGGGSMVPPHELVARVRMASFSVHEGAGRTLKGRDLSRVRNAIWKQIGFQD